jgi:photosystem II stability/assembly factor-like uncharacterized protein
MKRSTFILILLLFTHNIYSQSGWFWQNPLPQGNNINSISIPSQNTIFLSGYGGTILKSTNSGINWINLRNEANVNNSALFFLNDLTGFVGGSDYSGFLISAKILKTSNGGVTFFASLNDTVKDFNQIQFLNSNTGFVIASSYYHTYLYKTSNSGINWNKSTIKQNTRGKTLYFLNSSTGFAAVDSGAISYGLILMTTNRGINWERKFINTAHVNSINFINNLTGF